MIADPLVDMLTTSTSTQVKPNDDQGGYSYGKLALVCRVPENDARRSASGWPVARLQSCWAGCKGLRNNCRKGRDKTFCGGL